MERGIKAEITRLKEKGWVAEYVNGFQVDRRSTTTNDGGGAMESVVGATASRALVQTTTSGASPNAKQSVRTNGAPTQSGTLAETKTALPPPDTKTQGARSSTCATTALPPPNTKAQGTRSKTRATTALPTHNTKGKTHSQKTPNKMSATNRTKGRGTRGSNAC